MTTLTTRRRQAGRRTGRKTARAGTTFMDASEAYLHRMKGMSGRTRAMVLELQGFFGALELKEIGQRTVADYVHQTFWDDDGMSHSPGTVRRYLTQLKAVLTHAVHDGALAEVPRIEMPPSPPGRKRFLELDEIEALLIAAPSFLAPLLRFLLHTGARCGEALDLEWRDVDLKRAQVRFTSRKGGRIKTRAVPLSGAVVADLKALGHRTGTVWLDRQGRPWGSRQALSHHWDATLERAGLSDVRLHDLRRTFASHLLLEGTDLIALAELLGHENLQMLKASYAHVTSRHLTAAVARLPY